MRTINPNLLYTVSRLWTQSVYFSSFRRTDVLPIEWNHCMECSRVHTLWKWMRHIPSVSINPCIFLFSQRTPSSLILNAGSQWGSSLPPPMRISCYCLDFWGYVVCNNKREGAFPRFLMKMYSTKIHVLSMYTNRMHQHVPLSELVVWFSKIKFN